MINKNIKINFILPKLLSFSYLKYFANLSRSYIKGFVWYNLYNSQSVFKFSFRLHYHISRSYRVHKSCSYRVFSLQEFKQNDSRTSCNSNNYGASFREKQVKGKGKKRRICVKPWLKRKKNLKFYETLLAELPLKDEHNYTILLRMTSENFEKIFQLITKENIKMGELIPPRL